MQHNRKKHEETFCLIPVWPILIIQNRITHRLKLVNEISAIAGRALVFGVEKTCFNFSRVPARVFAT